MEVGSLTLYAIITVVSLVLYYIKNYYDYWKKRDIPYDEQSLFFRKSVGKSGVFSILYNKYKGTGPFAGFFLFTTPSVVLLDLDLIKNVFIKDFNVFDDRGFFHNERDDPLTANLISLGGQKWRQLRGKLTPTFTSGKMRFMFPTMVGVGEKFIKVLEDGINTNPDIEVKEMLARFTTDIIGTCAFGIECNSLKDPNAEFRKMGNKAFGKYIVSYKTLFIEAFPKLAKFLRLQWIPKDVTRFFTRIVEETVDYREKNNVRRNDFMDLLIDLKKQKSIRSENGEEFTALTMNEIIAQMFVFFVAGFETSSNAMSFALYELARHQDIQDKVRKEINDVTARYNGDITYEGIKEMVYLDQVIKETLRKYSLADAIPRKAKANYTTSNPKYVIPKGATVIVPVFGIMNDPDIFPNPDVFDPDRFTAEEVHKRHSMAWLPFGAGPKNCIGIRFGKMQAQVGLSMLIKNFKFLVTNETPIAIKLRKNGALLTSDVEIVLKIEKN